ncbi:hypothetical protein [Litchfieldia alkalitelluris]|uniref:hypothetical protein n=1 Tax=Litchfieldia alkalitelluris TaxID=304268 RepID=UPI000997CC7A|nr:hypothetical protein [Litchfieldia alkalitelluris]
MKLDFNKKHVQRKYQEVIRRKRVNQRSRNNEIFISITFLAILLIIFVFFTDTFNELFPPALPNNTDPTIIRIEKID